MVGAGAVRPSRVLMRIGFIVGSRDHSSSQFSVLSSQFSVLSSQFSVLSSQFSVLSSQFSVLSSQLECGMQDTTLWIRSIPEMYRNSLPDVQMSQCWGKLYAKIVQRASLSRISLHGVKRWSW